MPEQTQQLCTFYLGDLYLGLEVTDVLEVLLSTPLTSVPLAPPCVRGLMNLRGKIVSALDLRARLRMSPADEDAGAVNIVLNREEGPVSLLVDAVGDVIRVPRTAFEATPPTVDETLRDVLEGVYKTDGALLLVVDSDRVVDLID